MPRGRTRSTLSLKERKQRAFDLMDRGYHNAEIGRTIGVTADTMTSYRRQYEAGIQDTAAANPRLLTDILGNTIRSLKELDQVRMDAWQSLKPKLVKFTCEECDHENRVKLEPWGQVRAQLLNTILRAQQQRAALFGVLGVKAEVYAHMAQVSRLQTMLLEFMQRELCATDREKLAQYVERALGGEVPVVHLPELPPEPIEASARTLDDGFSETG